MFHLEIASHFLFLLSPVPLTHVPLLTLSFSHVLLYPWIKNQLKMFCAVMYRGSCDRELSPLGRKASSRLVSHEATSKASDIPCVGWTKLICAWIPHPQERWEIKYMIFSDVSYWCNILTEENTPKNTRPQHLSLPYSLSLISSAFPLSHTDCLFHLLWPNQLLLVSIYRRGPFFSQHPKSRCVQI